MNWQPIETAPKDGTNILIHELGDTFVAWWLNGLERWVDGKWTEMDGWVTYDPTHWMPLPPPPEDATK